ncbi:MAG: hypothetical protein E7060_06415 [Treponema bryantii]|nr:hypothetical protein [Treponema bryantii]
MNKYFCLQFKRLFKFSPYIFLVSSFFVLVILLCGYGYYVKEKNNPQNQKIKIGVVGESDINQLQMGLLALESFDETKHILDFELMTEQDAIFALNKDQIVAYMIFPEGFVDNILAGSVKTVSFVTKSDVLGIDLMFKEELTKAVSSLLIEAQKGVYGIQYLLDNNGYSRYSLKYLNKMNIEYIKFIINRNQMYEVTEIGVGENLSFIEYIKTGLIVFLFMLFFLPFSFLYTKRDYSINQLLQTKGFGALNQITSEVFSLTFFQSSFIFIIFFITKILFPEVLPGFLLFIITIISIMFLLSCFTLFICEISNNILNSLLLNFFLTVILCYISGCFYPIFTMPEFFQHLSSFLPSGRIFKLISNVFQLTKSFNFIQFLMNLLSVLLYGLLFLIITVLFRRQKIKNI